MAASNSVQHQAHQSNYQRAILEKIEDPVSYELMTRAVTIFPCGHTLNEDTVMQCLAHNNLCPIDRQPIERHIPNFTIRHIAETEEESYSPEAEDHFLKGKKASEEGDMEGAIEALLEALRLSPCYEKAQAYLDFCLEKDYPPISKVRQEEQEKAAAQVNQARQEEQEKAAAQVNQARQEEQEKAAAQLRARRTKVTIAAVSLLTSLASTVYVASLLFHKLNEREDQLDQMNTQLNEREDQLDQMNTQLNAMVAELEKIKEMGFLDRLFA